MIFANSFSNESISLTSDGNISNVKTGMFSANTFPFRSYICPRTGGTGTKRTRLSLDNTSKR